MSNNAGTREEIARLRQQLADAQSRRAALLEELVQLAARVPEIRRRFGNPFYYSHPEEPDEGVANYNPSSADEIGWTTWRALTFVKRDVERLRAELRRLGHDDPTH